MTIRSLMQFAREIGLGNVPDFTGLNEREQIRVFQAIYPATDDEWQAILRCARVKMLLGGRPEQMRSVTSKLKALDAQGKSALLGALAAFERVYNSRRILK